MPKYCLVVTITAADSAASVAALFGIGSTGLKDYVLGYNQDGATGEFQNWSLAFGGVQITQGTSPHTGPIPVDAFLLVAYVRDVSNAIRTHIGTAMNARPMLGAQVDFAAGVTRPQIISQLTALIGQTYACDHFWSARPGDDVVTGITDAASLLAKFSAVPGVP